MSQLTITGGTPLSGELTISGRKNAALKLIAASLLSDGITTIHRIPEIGDVNVMLRIMEEMGASVEREEDTVRISTNQVSKPVIPSELGRKLRASLVLVGPLLARFGHAVFPHPGGCVIGKRSITPHLEAFRQLGAHITFDGVTYEITAPTLTGNLIYLKEKSVTGTENVLMAAVRANGITVLHNAAEERHIVNLCELLIQMGYQLDGIGSSTLTIEGKPQLSSQNAEIDTISDEIEVGTFAVAAAITGGTVKLRRVGNRVELLPILAKLEEFQVSFTYYEDSEELQILPSPHLKATDVQTNPWPGFPPDLQSPFTVLATQASGTSLIHDWMFEGRLYFVDLLHRMGANIILCDPHRAVVTGKTPLSRSSSLIPDLRAGAALVLAALVAEGTSTVEHAELIDRGYARIDERLRSLGAVLSRE